MNNYAAVGLASTTRGSLTGGGAPHTGNLGTLTQGSGLISAALAALNAALGLADAPSLGIDSTAYTVESGSGFGLALNAFADLAAGDTLGQRLRRRRSIPAAPARSTRSSSSTATARMPTSSDNNANVLDPTLTIEATVSPSGALTRRAGAVVLG